jgi:hypothetical protein
MSHSKLARSTAVKDVALVVEDSYARILVGHRIDAAELDVDRYVAAPIMDKAKRFGDEVLHAR